MTDEDAAGLAALQTLEPSSDPAIAAALNDSMEDAACLAAMDDPASSAFTLSDSDQDAACLEALEAAEAEQLPLEFELIPHVERRIRKFGRHRRVYMTRLV